MKAAAMMLSMLLLMVPADYIASTYTVKDCTISNVEDLHNGKIVTVEDPFECEWGIKMSDDFEYGVGDKINIKLHDNGTEDRVDDDRIVKVYVD